MRICGAITYGLDILPGKQNEGLLALVISKTEWNNLRLGSIEVRLKMTGDVGDAEFAEDEFF